MFRKDILQINKLQKSSRLVQLPFENGLKMEKLTIIDQEVKELNDGIMSMNSSTDKQLIEIQKNQSQIEKESSMQESQQEINEMIWKDNVNISELDIQITDLLRILDQELITKEKDLKPFWTLQSKEISKKLWLPTKIDSVDLDMSSSNTLLAPTLKGKSWFLTTVKVPQKKKSVKMSLASSQSLVPELMVLENIKPKLKKNLKKEKVLQLEEPKKKKKKDKKLKTVKVRILPTKKQRSLLNSWFGISRWYYNRSIDYVRQLQAEHLNLNIPLLEEIELKTGKNKGEIETISKLSFKSVRNNMRKNQFEHVPLTRSKNKKHCVGITYITPIEEPIDKNPYDIPEWCKDKICPRIITGSIKDYCDSFKTQRILVSQGMKQHFTMRYRTKKDGLQSLNIEKSCFTKNNNFIPKYFGRLKTSTIVQGRERLKISDLDIAADCRLTYDKTKNQFYFNLPIEITESYENQGRQPVISLDPGIRTFQTGFALEEVVEFGKNTSEHLFGLQTQIGKLQSIYTTLKSKRSKRIILKVINRKYRKIKNMTNDLHWKTIKAIVTRYDNVCIPEFGTQQLLSKIKNKKQRFLLQTLSHYTFRMRLKWKCKLHACNFHLGTEEYTSKTCTNCGKLNDVGSSKHYKCSDCNIEIDRDFNGSRNILIKYLSEMKKMGAGPINQAN
jgi:transposase